MSFLTFFMKKSSSYMVSVEAYNRLLSTYKEETRRLETELNSRRIELGVRNASLEVYEHEVLFLKAKIKRLITARKKQLVAKKKKKKGVTKK